MRHGNRTLAGVIVAATLAGTAAVDAARTRPSGTPPFVASPRNGLSPEKDRRVRATLASLPLRFEANRGQVDSTVKFVHRAPGYTLFLTPDETVLSLRGADRPTVLRTRLVGGAPAAAVTGEGEQGGRTNFLRGSDPSGWTTGIASYAKVRCAGVYPGIDLVYHGTEGVLEYDFVLAPGADPGRIALDIRGVDSMAIDGAGDLVLATPAGEVRQHAPRVYQEVAGVRRAVAGRYALRDGGAVGFEVGPYEADRPLVIDPTLVYATYLGGNSRDIPYGIALGADGSVYVTGDTYSTDFPAVSPIQGTFQGSGEGDQFGSFYGAGDAFVTKLDPSGASVVYSTYLGGTGNDVGFGIAVDASGSAYITGRSHSVNFPVTPGAFQAGWDYSYYNRYEAFVCKLAPDGASLVYSTLISGGSYVEGHGIAVDGSGNAFVTGGAWSGFFPTTPGAIQTTHGGASDAFVVKLNPSGSALVYSTFLGGSNNGDGGNAIAVDSSGSAVVVGQTNSTGFPTANALQPALAGSADVFVARLNPEGTALVYSTFLGGDSEDIGRGVALDAAGNVYLAGESNSTNYPTTPGAFRETKEIYNNSFVTKINAAGSALVYSTFIESGSASGIAVDGAGNAFVTGYASADSGFPLVNPLFDTPEGTWNGFVAKLNAPGSALLYSTFVGYGWADDAYSGQGCRCIAVDAAGLAVAAGPTGSALPGTAGAYQASPPPGVNGIVLKILPLSAPAAPTGLLASPVSGSRIDLSWTDNSPEEEAYEVERSVDGGAFAPLAAEGADAEAYASLGLEPLRTYAHRVRATNAAGASAWTEAEATTLATLDFEVLKGKAADSATEQRDGFLAKGTLAFNGNSADGAFDPMEDAVALEFGDEDGPVTLAIPAGDPGWKAKNGKFTWKSAKGALPKAKLVIDTAKGTISLSVKGFDYDGAPSGTLQVLLRCGDDAGRHAAAWTEKRPGLLVR